MVKAAWEKDAERFGRRFKFGEWESALWVARSIEKGSFEDKDTSAQSAAAALRGKATTSEFAKSAGVGASTVRVYMRTWEFAAKAELVPYPQTLTPGENVELPDPALWKKYYDAANPKNEDLADTPVLSERWENWFNRFGNLMIDGARLAEETDDTAEVLDGYAAVARLFYDRARERQIDAEWREFNDSIPAEES